MSANPSQIAQFDSVPAPQAGINAIANLADMAPTDALYIYNQVCSQNGLTVRPGWAEWITNLTGTGGVRTIISSRGVGSGSQDFLFAVTADGIWNCTASTSAPTKVVTFGITTGNAGYCEWDHSTNAGGDVILMVCDEVNGYYTFDTNTSTWLKVTLGAGVGQVSNVDPATFASVRVFNNRVWFVQAGTGNSWYLPVGQVYGAATVFAWNNKFQHGGNLNNLYVFTYGSYYGTYIYLVGVGDAGDVIAYSGIDPNAAATWTLTGQWYVGDLPAGRRSCTNFGGDLLILCAQGALPVSSLFFQKNVEDPTIYITAKIAPAIARDMSLYSTLRGWGFVPWPSLNSLIITEPVQTGVTPKQFCYNLATKGWSVFQSLKWQCAAYWHGVMFAGTNDGRVIHMVGNSDGVLLNGTGAIAINWGSLSGFSPGKNPGMLKIVDLVQAFLITDSPASIQTFARYDFNVNDLLLGSVPFLSSPTSTGWDSGIWDSAIWSGDGNQVPQIAVQGVSGGPGKFVAIGILGASNGDCTHIGYNVSSRPLKGFL